MFPLLFFVLIIRGVSGVLILTPSDVAVLSGTVFSLHCATNDMQDLLWYRLSPDAQREDQIVDGGVVNAKFRNYSVQHVNQESNLTIVAGQSSAGRHACVEFGTTERVTAQVTVLNSEPSCSRHSTGDVMNLTCVVTYSGLVNPIVKWTQVAGQEEKEVTAEIETTQREGLLVTHTSTLLVQANESERNNFSYQYTVTFCLPDNATRHTRSTDGRSCAFSRLLHLDEEASGTTPRIGEEGIFDGSAGLWWISLIIVPLVLVPLVVWLGFNQGKRVKLQHPEDRHATAAAQGLVESAC